MLTKKECVAMLLAGGQGSRLYALTNQVAKPAVEFGAKNRIIDFPLSNCTKLQTLTIYEGGEQRITDLSPVSHVPNVTIE